MTDPVPSKDGVSGRTVSVWELPSRPLPPRELKTYTFEELRETFDPGDLVSLLLNEIDSLREDCRRWENARNVWVAEEKRLKAQVEELSIHAEKWVKRALGGDRASVFANPVTEPETFVVTAGQVTHYVQPPSRYTIEPHGDAHALYFGRDHMHHGFNLARITEATQETLALIEQALNGATPEPESVP